MISGEVGSWVRKHTGTADTETKDTIDTYIANAYMYYTQLCSDKVTMETITLNRRKQSQLLGVLFAEYEILTTEQASMIRDQMKKPQQVFANTDSLWAFYNFVTNALQLSHPKTWMEDQRMLHYFIGTIGNFSAPVPVLSAPVALYTATPIVTESEFVDPNQLSLLDQIADLEADQMDEDVKYAEAELADNQVVQQDPEMLEIVHQVEEILESLDEAEEVPFDIDEDDDAVLGSILTPIEREISPEKSTSIFPQDETVVYTDPAGNTFEAPVIPDPEDDDEASLDLIVEKQPDSTESDFDLDFNDTESEVDTTPDFF
jgi:hypothetical protein